MKAQRKQAKRFKQDKNSRLDYSRYDGGENAAEITRLISSITVHPNE